jgi:3-dehydroquinate dehydratase/shikimate dehydrogenase
MTSLCVSLTERRTVDLIDRMADLAATADLFEIRADLVTDLDQLTILRARPKPVIFTARPESEGGHLKDADPRRRLLLMEAGRRGFEFVDIEYRSGFFDVMSEKAGKGLIVSYHDFQGVPQDLLRLYDQMASAGADIVKIAVTPTGIADVGRVMELMRQKARARPPLVAIAMGPLGLVTRIVGGRYGAPFTFASATRGAESAPGQLTAEEMDDVYGVRHVGPKTRLYGLLGSDVAMSLSPAMHNAAFRARGIDAVYAPLQAESLAGFLAALPHLELSGFAVTRPFKVETVSRLQAADETVSQCGSVNTVTVHPSGELHGTSTDGLGVVTALRKRGDLRGKDVLILGAGGAARAAAAALESRGAQVRILARSKEKALQVAQVVGCAVGDLSDVEGSWDILVNATPVGDRSHAGETLVPKHAIKPGRIVFDMNYDPMETRLLRDAKEAGAEPIGGFEMLIAQATAQFEVWTGAEAPEDVMLSAALLRAQKRE